MLILGGYLVWKKEWPNFFTNRLIGLYCVLMGLIVLAHINFVTENQGDSLVVIKETVNNLMSNFNHIMKGTPLTLKGAGIIGAALSIVFTKLFATTGTYIVSSVIIVLGIVLLTGFDLVEWIKSIFAKIPRRKKEKKAIVESDDEEEIEPVVMDEPTEERKKYTISSMKELNDLYKDDLEGSKKNKKQRQLFAIHISYHQFHCYLYQRIRRNEMTVILKKMYWH